MRPRASPARLSLGFLAPLALACVDQRAPTAPPTSARSMAPDAVAGAPLTLPAAGQHIFRHWTFGNEPFWTDTLQLNQVVEAAVSPAIALAVGSGPIS
jgi:hypothetical protein